MIKTALLTIPLLAQSFILTIEQKNGEKIIIPTEDIEQITFTEEETPGPNPDPNVKPEEFDLTPGTSHSFFAPGVTAESGFVDVDKFGRTDPPYRDDSSWCWACSAACLSQWWLNDYKDVKGEDYPLVKALPNPSYYSTPVMDALIQAYNETSGGDCFSAFQWFFEGVKYNSVLNDVKCFNESYKDWKGGFAGMTHEEVVKIMNVQEESYGYLEPRYLYYWGDPAMKDLDANAFAIAFSMQTLECLQMGPFYVGTPNHALACFGVDYTVDANGKPRITQFYIAENDPVGGNVRNGLNKYGANYLPGKVWLSSAAAAGGGDSNTTKITNTFGVKSVRFIK